MPLGLTFILVRQTEKAVLVLCVNVSCKAQTKMLPAAFITEAEHHLLGDWLSLSVLLM